MHSNVFYISCKQQKETGINTLEGGCKAMAEDEIPQTRREFENMLRALEEKYRSGI